MKQALLVIDAQQELIDGSEKENPVLNKDALLININLVIEKALALGIEIIFIRDSDVAEGKGIGFESSSNSSEPINSISMYLLHPHIN
ncbi:isochorismatase family protein [Bacillus sp. sid0103]|nr:isochorismatase family protein [Bacillus sp. sid0103]